MGLLAQGHLFWIGSAVYIILGEVELTFLRDFNVLDPWSLLRATALLDIILLQCYSKIGRSRCLVNK